MKKILIVVTAFFLTLTVFAQPQKVVADKIIGIVGDKIMTSVRKLSDEERITTIATMLSGEKPGAAAFENARELLG